MVIMRLVLSGLLMIVMWLELHWLLMILVVVVVRLVVVRLSWCAVIVIAHRPCHRYVLRTTAIVLEVRIVVGHRSVHVLSLE